MRGAAKSTLQNTFNTTISAPAAEEQFLEQTPWANPQHPIHRLGISRQGSLTESYNTPMNQQRINTTQAGSASTIPENPSAQASSALNTPHDLLSSQAKAEQQGANSVQNYRLSVSPLESRKTNNTSTHQNNVEELDHRLPQQVQEPASSPLSGRNRLANSPPGIGSSNVDNLPRHGASPFPIGRDSAISTGAGLMGTGRFSVR